jgi:hypothetical protein
MDIFALSFGGWKVLSGQDKQGINKIATITKVVSPIFLVVKRG